MTAREIQVVLADDHPIVLAGIRALLMQEPGLRIAGEATNGIEALRLITRQRPDIAVLDVSMPGLNGVAVTRRVRDAGLRTRIIALTVHQEAAYLRQLLTLGMGGYVLKSSAADDLIRAIRAVHAGGIYFDPSMVGRLVETTSRRAPGLQKSELSEREEAVLRRVALGHTSREIAQQLSLGVKTVETYKARGMEKLGLDNRAELIRHAIGQGWMSGD
ncbi:MAG TPA: response regulator transcription factor [Rhodopila sp.]|nr:response regulator transcription factor [Rhodopila sp.]